MRSEDSAAREAEGRQAELRGISTLRVAHVCIVMVADLSYGVRLVRVGYTVKGKRCDESLAPGSRPPGWLRGRPSFTAPVGVHRAHG